MYCKKCGARIPDNAKFCPKCGAPVEEKDPAAKPSPNTDPASEGREDPKGEKQTEKQAEKQPEKQAEKKPEKQPEKQIEQQPEKQTGKKGRPKILVPVITVVAAVVVLISVFGVRSSRTLDLNDYLRVEFEGYDGYGTTVIDPDWDAIDEKFDKKMNSDFGYVHFSSALWDCISANVVPDYNVSNGDQVTVTLNVNAELLKKYTGINLNVSSQPETFTASGLEEPEPFDAFSLMIKVDFTGASPYVNAGFHTIDKTADQLDYSVSPEADLSIGDTVTVTIDEASVDAYVREYGKYPEELEREYVVEDVPSYVLSLDELPAEALDELKQTAEDEFNGYVADTWGSTTLTSLTYLGSYLLTQKNYSSAEEENSYQSEDDPVNLDYLVYKYQAEHDGDSMTGYWYCRFKDLTTLSDDPDAAEYSGYSISTYTGGLFIKLGEYFSHKFEDGYVGDYAGYSDLDSLFNAVVTANADKYDYESTVTE